MPTVDEILDIVEKRSKKSRSVDEILDKVAAKSKLVSAPKFTTQGAGLIDQFTGNYAQPLKLAGEGTGNKVLRMGGIKTPPIKKMVGDNGLNIGRDINRGRKTLLNIIAQLPPAAGEGAVEMLQQANLPPWLIGESLAKTIRDESGNLTPLAEKSVRGIGETAVGFATFLPQAALNPVETLKELPVSVAQSGERILHPIQTVKQGDVGPLLGDIALIAGGVHGVKGMLKGTPIAQQIPAEVRNVYDRMLRVEEAKARVAKKPTSVPQETASAPKAAVSDVAGQEMQLTELNAGFNPFQAMRMADDMSIRPSARQAEGSLTIAKEQRPSRDYDLRDRFLQPIGIYDPTGSPIQKGVYDRIGEITKADGTIENSGSQAGQRIRQTERAITDGILQADKTIAHIDELLKQTQKRRFNPLAAKALQRASYSKFIDLIEKPLDDPQRMQIKESGKPMGEALKLHDAMTDGFREYIIKSRKEMGIDTPDNWGITDRGYYRHLFLGNIRVLKNGEFVGTARTYAEAQKMAVDILSKEPKAKIEASARNVFFGDPTVRVSNKKYFSVINKLLGNVNDMTGDVMLSPTDIMSDIRGVVGRKGGKQKYFGALLKRAGAKGYSQEYADVMRMHTSQMYRSQEMSKMNRDIQPIIERIAPQKPGLAKAIEEHVNDLWGTPAQWEKNFGETIRNTPVLRNYVANPDFAFRHLARQLTGLQHLTKLRVSPRSALVNLIQPFSTLWPYISTKDFGSLYTDFSKATTRKMLVEKGVLEGSTKIESGSIRSTHKRTSLLNPLNWFTKASEVNRGVGYLFGYKQGLKRKMTEVQAHELGMAWAEKVEFDNSAWNVQPILRSPQGRVLGQFKSFAGKNLENVREVFTPDQPISKAQRVSRAAKWTGTQLTVGGIKSLGIATKLAGGYLLVNQLSKQLQSYGMKRDEADKWANAVYYGAPSLIGQDLSASVSILEQPYGRTSLEKAGNFVFGPTVGTAINVADALAKKDYEKTTKALTPAYKGYDVAKQALDKGIGGTKVKVGNNQYVGLTPFEAVMRALNFTPTKVSEVYDKKDAGIKKSRSGFGRF